MHAVAVAAATACPEPITIQPEADPEVVAALQRAFQLARAGDAAGLAALLDAGVPPDLCNERGDSLLMLASYHGHVEASRALLDRGADPGRPNDRRQTPLGGAAFKGDVAIAALLLDRGAEVDATTADGKTPLMFAAMFDRVEMVELLLGRAADPDRKDAFGVTAAAGARAMGAHRAAARLERR